MAELWCWSIMPHKPHEWSGTLDGKPQTFTCPGVSAVMVSRGDAEPHDSETGAAEADAWTEYQRWAGDGAMPQDMHAALFAAYPGASHEFLHRVWATPPTVAPESDVSEKA